MDDDAKKNVELSSKISNEAFHPSPFILVVRVPHPLQSANTWMTLGYP
jgi:hypothetical protein